MKVVVGRHNTTVSNASSSFLKSKYKTHVLGYIIIINKG